MEDRFIAYCDKYQVRNDGTVWSNDYNHTGQMGKLSHYLDRDGYPCVTLVKNARRQKKVVHRLVAELFLGPKPTPKHQVNHKNGIRQDNRAENLEWVTSRENTLHGFRVNGRQIPASQRKIRSDMSKGSKNPKAKLTEDAVRQIKKLRKAGQFLKTIARQFSISVSQVSCYS